VAFLIAHFPLDHKSQGPKPWPTWTVVEETSKGALLQVIRSIARPTPGQPGHRSEGTGLGVSARWARLRGLDDGAGNGCGGRPNDRGVWRCWSAAWPAGGCPAWRLRPLLAAYGSRRVHAMPARTTRDLLTTCWPWWTPSGSSQLTDRIKQRLDRRWRVLAGARLTLDQRLLLLAARWT